MDRVDFRPLICSVGIAAITQIFLNYTETEAVRVIPSGASNIVNYARQRMGLYKKVSAILQISSGIVVTICKNLYGTNQANRIALISIVFQVFIFVALMNHGQRPRRVQ